MSSFMLARIRNRFQTQRLTLLALLLVATAGLTACATREPAPLISDPTAKNESAIPWNQQEKWESEGQFGPMAEKFEQNSNHR
jgi:outer membrane biogenesis lipoprotein LolB